MKSSDFKRQPTTLRTLQEEPKQQKKVNWDRVIYLIILFSIVLWVTYSLISSFLIVKAEGQVLFKKLDIQFTDDIQVEEFYRNEGDSVEVGDSLFAYLIDNEIGGNGNGSNGGNNSIALKNNDAWAEKERLITLKKIQINNIRKDNQVKLLEEYKARQNQIKKEVYLNVYTADKLEPYYKREADIKTEIATIDKENQFLNNYLFWLSTQKNKGTEINMNSGSGGSGGGSGSSNNGPHIHKSPVKGTITQIRIEQFEVALQSQIVMSIHKPENLFVKAFFEQSDLSYIKKGDIVVKMGDKVVTDMMSYMSALSTFKKGDKTQVVVNRDGEMVEVEVTF